MSQAEKLQRWIDLMGALLTRRDGLTLAEIREKVPGYDAEKEESVRRTFMRDKEELCRLGVPLDAQSGVIDDQIRYVIGRSQFYLPYLNVVTPRGLAEAKRVDQYGYRSLGSLALSDEELQLLAEAASRVRQLGDPILAEDVRLALAKIAVDVPAEYLKPTKNIAVVTPRVVATGPTFALLTDAVLRRKTVTFIYRGIERNASASREVHPYGLAYTMGNWYLHAMDPARGGVRRFHLGRMQQVAVNRDTPNEPDFVVDTHFNLAAHARPVPAWELGEEPVTDVVVRFTASNGHVRSARAKGSPVPDDPDRITYAVRRSDPFCRWLCGLAGDAVPVSPPEIVSAWRALVRRTLIIFAPVGQ